MVLGLPLYKIVCFCYKFISLMPDGSLGRKGSIENGNATWKTHKLRKILANSQTASAGNWPCIGHFAEISVALVRPCNWKFRGTVERN